MLAATAVAAALRLFRIGHQSLWVDEVFTAWAAAAGERLSWSHLLENVHGPLHAVLVHVAAAVFGPNEWALRLPSAIAGVLTVPATAAVAGRWLGRETAAWAAWLAALSPFLVWYSQEARNYSLLVLCTLLAIHALLGLRERVTAAGAAGVASAAAGAMLSNFSFLLLGPLLMRLALAPGAARPARVRLVLVAAAVAVVAALPWMPQVARIWDWQRLAPARAERPGETALRGATTFHAAAIPFTAYTFAVGYTLGPSLRELRAQPPGAALRRHAGVVALVAAVWGVLAGLGLRAVARRRRLADAVLWGVAPALVVSYFALQNFKVFHPRYLMVAAPLVPLLGAAALADLRPRSRGALAAGVIGLCLVSLARHYFDPSLAREDYRGALARVERERRPGEQIVAAGSVPPVAWYAGGTQAVQEFWLGFAADTVRMEARARELLTRAPGSWIIASRTTDLDPDDRFARWLDRAHPHALRLDAGGVRVWHVPTPGAGRGAGR